MQTTLPPLPELDYQLVMGALKGYTFPRKALSDLIKRGDLIRVKRGVYVQSGRGIHPYSREILANMIYGPSYVSFEYALAYHGLIPERVDEVTSATTGKTKSFGSPIGKFSYVHVPLDYYRFGYSRRVIEEERAFLVADPEKALADRVLRETGRFSLLTMKQFLFDNLRIDPAGFRNLGLGPFVEAVRLSGRESLEMLLRARKGLP